MAFNKQLHTFQYNIFTFVIYLSWFLYIIIVLGLSTNAPEYLDTLQSGIKIYVSLFLMLRFNPFRHIKFTSLDGEIAFNAGLFLFATTAINNVLQTYLHQITLFVLHRT
jgi:hypothetical protein